MRGGLAVLAKFQALTINPNGTGLQYISSWVIDWRLAARLFTRLPSPMEKYKRYLKLEDTWATRVAYDDVVSDTKKLTPWPCPPEHRQFCEDNRKGIIPYSKLILGGVVDLRYHASGRTV
jgi:hypothetical protein